MANDIYAAATLPDSWKARKSHGLWSGNFWRVKRTRDWKARGAFLGEFKPFDLEQRWQFVYKCSDSVYLLKSFYSKISKFFFFFWMVKATCVFIVNFHTIYICLHPLCSLASGLFQVKMYCLLLILSDFSPLDGLLLNHYHCCDFRCHREQWMMGWKVLVKLGSKVCAKTQWCKSHTGTSCCSSTSLYLNAFASSACWTLLTFCHFSTFSVQAATSIKGALIAPFSLLSQWFSFTFITTFFFPLGLAT